jgi:hypothetical protein
MKKVFLLAGMILSSYVYSQSSMKDDVDYIQKIYGKTKTELVSNYMNLSGVQSEEFMKIYDSYEAERKSLGQNKIKLISDYAQKYETLTDQDADALAKASLKNNMDYEKLYSKYYDKFKKSVGAINAAKFIQLESYLQTEIRSAIQNNIPFIGEIDRTKR